MVSAEKLFREKGIKTTKMTDIARDCELGKSSLYFYFKSKDEIVWHLLKKYSLEEYEAGHGYLRSIEGTAYEKLSSYFELFTDRLLDEYTTTSPSFQYREYMMDKVAGNGLTEEMESEFQELVNRNLAMITKLIHEGVADGSMKVELDQELLGNAIGNSFGTYFRYLIGLKATYDGSDFMNQKKEELKVYIQMVLAFLKN